MKTQSNIAEDSQLNKRFKAAENDLTERDKRFALLDA